MFIVNPKGIRTRIGEEMKRCVSMCLFVMIFLLAVPVLEVEAANQDAAAVFSDVYAKTRLLFPPGNNEGQNDGMRFACIRHGGFLNELEDNEWSAFSNLCMTVSNSYVTIFQNWGAYSTNEVVRFSILNAVSFSGETIYTNSLDRLVLNSSNLNEVDLPSVEYLYSPFGTPMEQYLAMNFDVPSVSNLLVRISSLAERCGNTNLVRSCSRRISGEMKQWILENR